MPVGYYALPKLPYFVRERHKTHSPCAHKPLDLRHSVQDGQVMSKETLDVLSSHERKLTLDGVLRWLVQDGMVSPAEAEKLARNHKEDRSHPLMVIAGQQWSAAPPAGKLRTIDFLTEWLGGGARGAPFPHHPPPIQFL